MINIVGVIWLVLENGGKFEDWCWIQGVITKAKTKH